MHLQAIILYNFREDFWTKLEKMEKNLVSGPILAFLAQIPVQIFFSVDCISTKC